MSARVVLIVEDNPDDEALILRAFRKHKLANEVVVARDGEEALEWLFAAGRHAGREAGRVPAVVMMDLKLPKLDGLEVLRRIRGDERTWSLPVVILTSSKEEQDIIASYRLGANSYVRKPVEFESFMEAVGRLGLYWLLFNDSRPAGRMA
ncbi:MAG: response regulator [Elusimicrobia bacterium]|nr:response regulator [Elusimicrobiota bacterium]